MTIEEQLKDIKRRLGPYTRAQSNEPTAVNMAELARMIQQLIDLWIRHIDES